MSSAFARFVDTNTEIASAPLVPEIRLRVAHDAHAIFEAAEGLVRQTLMRLPPYWAFAWPGGQALARHLLDNPSLVHGRRVIDVGAGSGIGAIAAALAGAADVLAADIDAVAGIAIRKNAGLNGQADRIATTTRDVLGDSPNADVVLISDLVYEPELALRVGGLIERASRHGSLVLLGDRVTSRQPTGRLESLARYRAPLFPPLADEEVEDGRVWRVTATGGKRAPAGAVEGL